MDFKSTQNWYESICTMICLQYPFALQVKIKLLFPILWPIYHHSPQNESVANTELYRSKQVPLLDKNNTGNVWHGLSPLLEKVSFSTLGWELCSTACSHLPVCPCGAAAPHCLLRQLQVPSQPAQACRDRGQQRSASSCAGFYSEDSLDVVLVSYCRMAFGVMKD